MAAVASTAPYGTQGRRVFNTGENLASDTRGDKILTEIEKLRIPTASSAHETRR
jgi:hypothetical protein